MPALKELKLASRLYELQAEIPVCSGGINCSVSTCVLELQAVIETDALWLCFFDLYCAIGVGYHYVTSESRRNERTYLQNKPNPLLNHPTL